MVEATTRQGMSLEDFLEKQQNGPFEIIDGEIVPMSPTVSGHSELIRFLFLTFYGFTHSTSEWEVYQETTFVKPDANASNWVEGALQPDIMLLRKADVDNFRAHTPDAREKPFPTIPVIAIEVLSPTDRLPTVLRKIAVYLELGVQMIWLVNPRTKTVSIYSVGKDEPEILGSDATLTLDDLLPGFSINLTQLFQ